MAYFQEPGVADAELGRNPRETIRRLLYSASGDVPQMGSPRQPVVPAGGGFLDLTLDPATLPDWLTEGDIDFYATELERTGFTGGLNWYRTIDLSWELMAPWQGANISVPSLYIAGDRDLVVNLPGMNMLLPRLNQALPGLRGTLMLPGCGHWTQQERPTEVNAALIEFLEGL
ncbi:MAG TPA: alpha/beta hydrolase, partial [Chloroflexota bacterium]|nr:alpha/beta hydrolase [Chloroflexota bacterium]